MHLIPIPRKIINSKGFFKISLGLRISLSPKIKNILPARLLADEIEGTLHFRPDISRGRKASDGVFIYLEIDRKIPSQSYKLIVSSEGIFISGGDEAGIFYGVQTLRQIIRQNAPLLPFAEISDEPDFPARGYYYDGTRGKVPKLETLMMLAEKMAFYKLNQLQIYVEHTYAFRKHSDTWAGSDPFTAEEIMLLDEQCKRHHVDLVPSLSTFGHFYTALASKRKEHLNELDIMASDKPFSFWDRMQHYTLDCSNPGSLELVAEMIEEYSSIFTSRFFNICCDETFDLGKGKNRVAAQKHGEEKLYAGFLKKIIRIVKKQGKIPMFWGDIILKKPELIREIPKDSIILNWDYSAIPSEDNTKAFSDAGMNFYVCPGVSGWNRLLNDITTATDNIVKSAGLGKKYGAHGLLNTDWGDYGHVNMLASSYHGMILGAQASWNHGPAATYDLFDKSFSIIELGDKTAKFAGIMRAAASCQTFTWGKFCWWLDATEDMAKWERDTKTGMFTDLLKINPRNYLDSYRKILKYKDDMIVISRDAKASDPLALREIILGTYGSALLHAVILMLQKASGLRIPPNDLSYYYVADELRIFERELSEVWHMRNKPSEYFRIRLLMLDAAKRIDALF